MIVFNCLESAKVLAVKIECSFDPAVDVSITRESNGKLLGGVLYKEFTGASIHMHVAGLAPNWGNVDLLWVAFNYPFEQLGCSKVFGFLKETNKASLAFNYKLGFKYVTRVPGVFPEGDLIILAMERGDCRWLKLRPRTLKAGVDNE